VNNLYRSCSIAYCAITFLCLLCSGPARSQDAFTVGYDAGYRDGCFAGGGSLNEKGDCVPSAPISTTWFQQVHIVLLAFS
jgi:uncharacterized protein YijF (DUF1287 family)